jgi:hypothetical protein
VQSPFRRLARDRWQWVVDEFGPILFLEGAQDQFLTLRGEVIALDQFAPES